MSNNHDQDDARPAGEPIGPADSDDPQSIADEQFIHGLLGCLHGETSSTRERRITRVLDAIQEVDTVIHARWWQRSWRPLSAAAGLILILFVLALLGLPTEQSAYAIVQASIEASRTAGDRRYEVFIMDQSESTLGDEPEAIMDLGATGHLLIRATMPQGHELIIGRDDEGNWTIRRDGSIERFMPESAWPRWIDYGESTVLVESVDKLLQRLDGRYRLSRGEPETLDDGTEAVYARVTAELTEPDSPDPECIDFWIDLDSHIVQRMELRWPEQRRRWAGGNRGDGPPPRGGRGRPGGPPPDGEHGRLGGPPPDGEHRRPGGPSPGGEHGRPGGPPPGEGSGADRPPPRFIDGPPRFGEGAHPPPPEVIVFSRVEPPEFQPDWFDPERHVKEQ